METELPSLENSDRVFWTTDDQGPSHVRSYECIFCKRGFSNAQALGGHMNIHRKDRAKLKQPSTDNILSSDITSMNPSIPPVSTDNASSQPESGEERSSTLQQLPLFAETPSTIKDLKSTSRVGRLQERRRMLSHGSPMVELDLELRLGPEPQHTSIKGNKEFF
ncbi:hypothetical protein HHK36_016341 [Tetracentron sinense]|uniref:C2H2-type domain-containing protein n=1 Tax=Tetracentron sinense TaxID=13715 RepID=A0A834Z168_TETSI|nr:hypothetical protein HHK36_016341 [Tetracentron sinense]